MPNPSRLPSQTAHAHLLRLVQLSLFVALAYALSAAAHFLMPPLIPATPFLKYDPKDIVVAIAAFLYGPLSGVVISAVVSLIEMVTISDTGPIGAVMNVVSTAAFVCPAALWYRRRRTLRSAVTGLTAGVVCMAAVMLLWNYLLTPLYMGWPREAVAALLLPAFLPFNLIKGALNMALTLLLYKPLRTALSRARLLPAVETTPTRRPVGLWLFCAIVLVTCVLIWLALAGVL